MKKLFNDNWAFKLLKIGAELNDAFSDSGWKSVEIPHDWLIYDTSKLYETGEGWYRKVFSMSAGDSEKCSTLIFDGVYMNCTVFVNGEKAGDWAYGYTSFHFDISAFLKEGQNTIAVRVRHEAPNTRWYSGAGIFRNVWLNVQNNARIITDGIYISTNKISDKEWELSVETETEGAFDTILHTLMNADGEIIQTFENKAVLENINLWDTESPYVYRLVTKMIQKNEVVDSEINPVGFRRLEFTPDKGFFLNGRNMKLHGVCLHHDLGALGAAYNQDAARRQCEIMLDMGVNAIRISHNPPAREFLDLCDELGILAINEAFDIWELPKNKNDYARFFPEWHKKDIASWVRRDRNHPSVFMWSIGNEIYDTHKDEQGRETAIILRDEVLKHDPKQNAHVTIASNFMPFENAQKTADEIKLAGYNYAENMYDLHHEEHPDWFIYGSENVAAVRSRGVYRFPAEMPILTFEDRQCSDLGNSVVGWGSTFEKAWIEDRDRAFVGGQFIWTGIDYIGEPTPYWTKNSYFGAVDTAGLPKAVFWFYKSVWNKKAAPFIKLFPHWDWNEGQLIDVIAYSNLEEAELFLNGKSLGRQKIDHAKGTVLHFEWKVPYEKGEIIVKAYKDGEFVTSDIKRSFGEATGICFDYEMSPKMLKEGELEHSTKFIRIYVVDKDGVQVENARNRIYISTSGETKLLGLDNGDSTDFDSYKGDNRRLFGGQMTVIFTGSPRDVHLRSPGLVGHGEPVTGEMPLRKIELSADRLVLTKENPKAQITAKLLPENADYKNIAWKCVLDTGAEAEFVRIKSDNNSAIVEAFGDGRFKIRATCNNGRDFPQIISELNFEITGVGDAIKNPFSFISASQYDISRAPLKIIEHGSVAGVNKTKTLIGFKNVDFGNINVDLLRLYIGTTSYFDEVLVDVLIDGNLLETVSFPRNNLHYDFKPHDFKLSEKITGKHDVSFEVDRRCVFGGFEFVNERVFNEVYANEKDEIYGDNYSLKDNKIEKIGNNVIIIFNELDFGAKATRKLIISGFAPKGNSISLKISGKNNETSHMLEFTESKDYITQEFDAGEIEGKCSISFIFLPGSDFNFEWFKFE